MKNIIIPKLSQLDIARFWSKVKVKTKKVCWPMRRCPDKDGYGRIKIKGEFVRAHRVSYLLFHNKQPGELLVLHECDNPSCCNPKHLFLGTNDDNMRDMVAKKRSPFGNRNVARKRPGIRQGIKNGAAKLNDRKVRQIRRKHSVGNVSFASLGREYGVVYGIISAIVKRKLWAHVAD